LGRRPLGLLRVMIFTPNQVKLWSVRSGNNKLTKTTQKCTYVDRRYQKASDSLYVRLGCPSPRARLLDPLGWPLSWSGTDGRVRARAQFHEAAGNTLHPTIASHPKRIQEPHLCRRRVLRSCAGRRRHPHHDARLFLDLVNSQRAVALCWTLN